ncbi:MAG: hypothetical protein A2V64_00385 [Bacteroidetes bacterium RBG_13_43_22]|nr:MAG: hypothetical protein A2V64_00385 [Bacteroidetes bacterium RBG_13_43_22]
MSLRFLEGDKFLASFTPCTATLVMLTKPCTWTAKIAPPSSLRFVGAWHASLHAADRLLPSAAEDAVLKLPTGQFLNARP